MAKPEKLRPPHEASLVSAPEVLRALVRKELKVKYKRSVLGFAWSLVTPLALTAVYLFVFVYVYKVPNKDFILFLLSGVLPWNFFNMTILAATPSLVENGPLIRRAFFPRQLIPLSTVMANLINFLMALGVLIVIEVISGRPLWLTIGWLVLALVLETVLCAGVALALSGWNVYFRDIAQLISIFTLVLFFSTPIVYELSQVPARWRLLLLVNPLTPIMETYHSALWHIRTPDLGLLLLAVAETALVFAVGYMSFRRIAPTLAKEV